MRRDYNTEASKIRSDECNADEGGTGGGERERGGRLARVRVKIDCPWRYCSFEMKL